MQVHNIIQKSISSATHGIGAGDFLDDISDDWDDILRRGIGILPYPFYFEEFNSTYFNPSDEWGNDGVRKWLVKIDIRTFCLLQMLKYRLFKSLQK